MAYSCTLKIGSTTYTDLHKIIDFRTLSIVSPLCSTDKKSGKGTMSVSVVANKNIVYYRLFMTALLGAQEAQTVGDCEITITEDSTVVFRGYLDLSNIQINSAKLPQNLTLSAIDKSTLLDKKIRYNHYWENKKRSEIVQDLLAYLGTDYGISVTFLTNALPDSKKIKYFAVAEGKEQTYRDVIDKILFESAGYVLWYDPVNDGFSIREIPTSTTGLTPRIVTYLVDNQLQTKSAIYNKDGVLLSFPNVVERPNTNIFTQDINSSLGDGGYVDGEKIQPGEYFPTDGDVKEIYQEYSIADRAYISGESRLQNENLKLLYAKDAKYYLASNPPMIIAPPIPLVKWKGTIEFLPDRARILFVNNNENESNVSVFSITGTAVYQNYLNKVTVGRLDPDANGAACTNPEEYLADTIQYKEGESDYSEAIAFAKWYYKSLNYGQTTSSWAEIRGNAYVGEVVYVAHKETGIMMPHVIVQITNQSKNNSTIRMDKIVAISIYGWEEFVYDTGVSASGKGGEQVQRPNQWFSGTVLKGDTTARGVAGIIGDWYLNTVTYDIYQCTTAGSIVSAIWTYKGNIKGEDADVTSQTYEVQYGLSTSDSEFIFPSASYGYDSTHTYGYDNVNEYGYRNYEWDSSLQDWHHGLYVWTRVKITDSEGNVTYGDPTYAKDVTQGLIDSCVIELSALPSSYTSNMRNAGDQYLFLNIKDIGYKGTLTIHTDTGVFARYNTATDTWEDLLNSIIINLNGTSNISNYGIKLPYAIDNNVAINGEFVEWNLAQFTIKTLSICPFIEKNVVVQLDTVDTYADLPTLVNRGSQDANLNDNLIKGDYILVKFLTLVAATTTQAIDETGKQWDISELSSYYDSNLDPITVSAFVVDATYYAFAIYAWVYDGTQWTRNPNSAVEINTVKEAVDLAQIQHDLDPTVDYHRCLYAHQILVEKLTAGVINVGNIFVNDIESTNYSEDADGTPTTGYKLEHEEGIIKAVNAKFVNAEITGDTRIGERAIVQGVIQNIDENGEMAFETVKNEGETATYTASKEDGVDAPNAYSKSEWLAYLISFINSSLTNKSVYAIDNCRLNDANNNTITNLDSIVRFSSVSGATSTFIDSTGGTEQETKRVWTNPYSTEITISSLSVKEKFGSFQQYTFGSGYSLVVYYSNGSVKSTLFNVEPSVGFAQGEQTARRSSVSNVVIPPNGYVNVIWNRYSGIAALQETGYAYVSYNESANFSVGIYVFRNGVKYQLPSLLGNTGFSTLDGTTITIHGFSAKTLDFTPMASWVSGVNKYYAFTWTVAPTNPIDVITSFLGDASFFYYAGNAVPIGYVRYSATSLSIASTDETVYALTGTFVREHRVRLDVKANVVGVRTQNLMPVYKDGERIGDGTIGSVQEPFHQVYSDLVNGIVVGTSTRDKKTNIHIYEGNALDILKRVTVKQFNYKFEIDTERCYTHYGFIAEETPEELATPFHDVMEEQSCIGILIKAIQELSAEINKLKGGN